MVFDYKRCLKFDIAFFINLSASPKFALKKYKNWEKKNKILKSENLKIRVHFETEMFDNGDTKVLARWERLLHVQMFNKRNLYQFLWMDNLYCAYMYIILRVSVTQSLICRCSLDDGYMFICIVVFHMKVCMCVWLFPLGQSVFQFANFDTFWKTWLRTCTCLILNIFCSPVVSMKSHLSLRTNTNVLILFLTTVFRRRKMTALFILYVFNSFYICL